MDYVLLQTPGALAGRLPALAAARVIGVDLETTGLDPHRHEIRLIQLAAEGLPTLVLDCRALLPQALPLLEAALSTPAVKVMQNAKFDLQFLLRYGIEPRPLFDTMLAGRLLYMPGTPRGVNLQALAAHYLGRQLDKREQAGDWDGPLREAQLAYAATDAEVLPGLRAAMIPQIRGAALTEAARIEFACVPAIAAMEYAGIALDDRAWQTLTAHVESARRAALEALTPYTGRPMAQTTLWGEDTLLGPNLDSPAYVLSLLRRHGIEAKGTARGDLYPYREHPLVQAFSAYRKASRALSSVLYPVLALRHPVTGRLHPHYGQISAYSGRMSCANPNIQQIPRDAAYRACFIAPQGFRLVIADYSQIELRVAAQLSGDARMRAAYRAGEDLHRLTASLLSGDSGDRVTHAQRQAAKAVNFGLIYGMGAAGLRQYAELSYGVAMSDAQAARFRERFFEAYPGVAQWHRHLKHHPPAEGRTRSGRRFPVSAAPSLPELSNAPVQGTAADILKNALALLHPRLAPIGAHIIAAVHDEILLECPAKSADEAADLLAQTMAEAARPYLPDVPAPADATVCQNWAQKK